MQRFTRRKQAHHKHTKSLNAVNSWSMAIFGCFGDNYTRRATLLVLPASLPASIICSRTIIIVDLTMVSRDDSNQRHLVRSSNSHRLV